MLPLLHVQWGDRLPTEILAPVTGYTHMFCVPRGDDFAIALANQHVFPNAIASVVSHGMDESDWRFILTSDI